MREVHDILARFESAVGQCTDWCLLWWFIFDHLERVLFEESPWFGRLSVSSNRIWLWGSSPVWLVILWVGPSDRAYNALDTDGWLDRGSERSSMSALWRSTDLRAVHQPDDRLFADSSASTDIISGRVATLFYPDKVARFSTGTLLIPFAFVQQAQDFFSPPKPPSFYLV